MVVFSIGLLLLVWLAFSASIQGEFVSYDDGDYVYNNAHVTAGLSLDGMRWAFTHVHASNWHPLTTMSHMLDCQLYGLEPWGHHLTNVLLHGLAAVLLFVALSRLTTPNGRASTPQSLNLSPSVWSSAFVSALFAIHPLRVESVAWISERKDVLSGIFFSLTLLAYAGYVRKNQSARSYLFVLICFALGLLCKPTLVTVPFVLLLLDFWPLGRIDLGHHTPRQTLRQWWPLVREKIPLFVLSAASCLATIRVQAGAIRTELHLTLAQRLANAVTSYAAYLAQLVRPTRLTILYPYANRSLNQLVPAALVLGVISSVAVIYRRRYPFLLVGWLWYLGMLVPMIGLVQVGLQPRADRYTYLPQIGLYLALTSIALVLLRRFRWRRIAAATSASAILIALLATTRAQVRSWQNSETLWQHAVDVTANNYVAYDNLGTVLMRRNRPDAALGNFEKALEIKPDFEDAVVSAGSCSMLMGQLDRASGYFRNALQITPTSAENWSNLATVLLKKGETTEAIADYEKAAALKPDSAEMQYNLANALSATHNWSDAISRYQTAARIKPDDARIRNNLAAALSGSGKNEEAIQELRTAIQIDPTYPDAHLNLGSILASLGRTEEGAAQLREALRLRPGDEAAKRRLNQMGISGGETR